MMAPKALKRARRVVGMPKPGWKKALRRSMRLAGRRNFHRMALDPEADDRRIQREKWDDYNVW